MKKVRIFGLIVGTVFYCLITLYFALFGLYNSVGFIWKLSYGTYFTNNFLKLSDSLIGTVYLSIVGIVLSCILLTVMYRKTKIRCLLLWISVLLYILEWIVIGSLYTYPDLRFILWIICVVCIAEAVYAVYAFVKTVREKKNA